MTECCLNSGIKSLVSYDHSDATAFFFRILLLYRDFLHRKPTFDTDRYLLKRLLSNVLTGKNAVLANRFGAWSNEYANVS